MLLVSSVIIHSSYTSPFQKHRLDSLTVFFSAKIFEGRESYKDEQRNEDG